MQLHPSSTRDRIDGDGEEEEGCVGGGGDPRVHSLIAEPGAGPKRTLSPSD